MEKNQSATPGKPSSSSKHKISRLDFLKISGGTGLFIFFPTDMFGLADQGQRGRGYPTDPNAYLKIGENNRVALYCSKIEMGQGIYTSMAQMLAEELNVSINSIDMVMGDTLLCAWDSGTTGSRSTKYFGPSLRNAGAEAKAVLLELAAEKFEVAKEQLVVENGEIRDKNNPSKKVSFGELVKGKHIKRFSGEVQIKPISKHHISGKSLKRTDALEKITGKAHFTGDIQLPGMLYAKVLRPPAHGARLVSVDVSKAEKTNQARVINTDGLVAVLHENPEIAVSVLAQIDAKWEQEDAAFNNSSVFEALKKASPEGRVYVEQGKTEQAKLSSKKIIETEFYNHYVAHAPLEPYTVLADVKENKVRVWASTQAPFRVQETAAEAIDVPVENVHVMTPFVGGGFGGKKSGHQVTEAVRLSKISGRPVLLAWTREEEFFYDAYRPAALVNLSSGLSEKGKIEFWECDIHFTGPRSSEPIYDIPHYLVKTHDTRGVHHFATGAWRGPGSNTNVFAMESHTDILAQAAEMDPLQFRLKNLTDERMLNVLNAAVKKFGQSFSSAPSGKGFGISCTDYLNTYVATIAEVSVNTSTGDVQVKRVVCAQDMGEIINPHGAEIQIEGGITMGLSAALFEEVEFNGGEILSKNFNTYRITHFSDVPKIDVVLVDNPEIPPQGCGEPAITTIGAALANAIFDACGARLFTLPMSPERILEALKKS